MTRSDSVDVKRWRAKYALIERAAESDKDAPALFAELDAERAARNGELREILADLLASSDLLAFKEALNHWARKDGPYVGFGPIGSPWLAALVRRAEDDHAEVVDLLKVTLLTPASPQDAADKLQSVDAFFARGGSRGQRAPGSAHTSSASSVGRTRDCASARSTSSGRRLLCPPERWCRAPRGRRRVGAGRSGN